MAFSIYDLLNRKNEKKKKAFDLFKFLREKVSGIEQTGEKVGKKLQEFPDTTIRKPQIKTGSNLLDFLLNPNPIQRKIEESISSVSGNIARSYGKTTERLSTAKGREEIRRGAQELRTRPLSLETLQNPAVQTAFDVSDFVPGIGLFGVGGIKKIAKEGIEQVAKKEVKEKVIPQSFDFILNPQRFAARLKELEKSGRAPIKEEFLMFKKWSETIKNPISLDRIRRFIGGEGDLLLLPKERRVAEEMQDYLTKFPKAPTAEQIAQSETQALKEAQAEMRASKALDPNQQVFTKMRNLLRIAGEKQSKIGELYREHIPKNIFGQSSDELASTMGISENELMANLTKGLNISEGLRKSRGFTNVRGIDNPLIFGKEWQRTRNVEESQKFVSEMLEESRKAKDPANFTNSFDDLVRKPDIDVRKKVNILDYLRTPNRVLEKIGLGEEAKLLRNKYDDYLSDLPKEIDKITAWSKRVPASSNQRIFQWLDGDKIKLNNEELKVAEEVKGYLKQWAIRLKLPEDKQVSNYITHLFEKGKIEKEFDPELAKLISGKVVKSVYDPFLQRRVGKPEYIQDTWRALDAYVKRATRKFHMDQALEKVAAKAEDLPLESYNYVKGRVARINMQPTDIDNLIDNLVKSSPIGYRLGQRPVATLSQTGRQMVFRGLLGLNPGTALRNLQQSTNSYAVLGEKNFGIGLMKTVQNLPRLILGKDTELEAAGVLGKNIVQDRTINATRKFWQYADDTLFYMFNMAEKVNRGIAYWGAKSKGLSQGMDDIKATQYAKDVVGKTQFYYDVIDTPAALQSDISKTLFQFGKYPLAQTEFLVEMVKDKNVLGSLRWIGANLLFIATAGKLLGLDYEDMFPDYSRFTPSRFMPPTLQPLVEIGKAGFNVPNEYGQISDEQNPLKRILESKDVQRGVLNYIPAGAQLRKSFEGAQAVKEGASLTPTGRVRFEVPQNLPTALQSILFGQYSLPQAKEYFEKRESGKSRSEVLYDEIKDLPTNEKLKAVLKIKIENPTLFDEVKKLMRDDLLKVSEDDRKIRELPIVDGSRPRAILREFQKLKTKEEKQKLFTQMLVKRILTKDVLGYFVKEKINLIE